MPFGKSVIGEEMGDLVENIHVFIGQGWNACQLNPGTGLASVKEEMGQIHSIRRINVPDPIFGRIEEMSLTPFLRKFDSDPCFR